MDGGRDVGYARSTGGIDIAYRVLGDGPVDLVYVSGFVTHLDLSWQLPHFAWLEHLDGVARVITFDKRGTGLSDRSLGFGSIEERADDVRAVMEAVGSQGAFVLGVSEGGPMSMVFAASFPERVLGLVLHATTARFLEAEDYPIGFPDRVRDRVLADTAAAWGTGDVFGGFIQDAPDRERAQQLIARFERNACTPKMAVEIMQRNLEIDVRSVLPTISVPTLVLHAQDDPVIPVSHGRFVADHIPGAQMVTFPGAFHGSWLPGRVDAIKRQVIAFMREQGGWAAPTDRVLATVVFTDIAASTRTAARLGDGAWHAVLDQHDRLAEGYVARFGGRLVKTTGDGVLATFDGPSRGISFASALADSVAPLGISVRGGIHTGEVELRGDDVAGVGVVIARRLCDLAEDGEVLVSRTVKDLVSGSRVAFVPRGHHALKGLADEWELFAVGGDGRQVGRV